MKKPLDVFSRPTSGLRVIYLGHNQKGHRRKLVVQILNFVDYHKETAIEVISRELGWRNYGNKHDESVFTKFYQDILLYEKFGIDKRKAHYSSLICTDQISREDALSKIEKPPLSDESRAKSIQYVLKKLELSESEFNDIMKMLPRKHWDFASYAKRKQNCSRLSLR